ncbi:putative ABC transport system ATP-binding protein [Lipingzhangella halophila]|uniref:Putative ABC transport system ATP-binding protein n=1 Tax=Lipingzhangella halophila TaxID=1783352 RepID=A0A7W7RHZ3_9ACTN|nr:ABC transporter ATP-binding protein [Lipingzhangella halophila]MBB4932361.1 putative ABC transport system ATP-binding protein [Lipingzhangella halophila]
MTDTTEYAVRAANLGRTFGSGDARVAALDGVDTHIRAARLTAIMGPSGSGKSTLVQCLAGLERPTTGEVWIGTTELSAMDDDELTELRRDRIGFVFQSFNLIPTLTAWENVTLPLDLAGRRPDRALAATLTDTLGLRDRLDHRPSQLSGGQQQRVACARALITEPDVVFADEPTGALDSASSEELLALLRHSVDTLGRTVVLVTHEPAVAAHADRVLFLADGQLVDELPAPTADTVLDRMKALERTVV